MEQNKTGLGVDVTLDGIRYERSLDEDISIDNSSLDYEFSEQAKRFAWWAVVGEISMDVLARQKYSLDVLYAQLDQQKRAEAQAVGVKLTEKMVENSVITDPLYREAMNKYLDIKKQSSILQAGKAAFLQRKDMLVSLGANYRAEGVGDPVVKSAVHHETQAQQKRFPQKNNS